LYPPDVGAGFKGSRLFSVANRILVEDFTLSTALGGGVYHFERPAQIGAIEAHILLFQLLTQLGLAIENPVMSLADWLETKTVASERFGKFATVTC
jgi:hypothetical protein